MGSAAEGASAAGWGALAAAAEGAAAAAWASGAGVAVPGSQRQGKVGMGAEGRAAAVERAAGEGVAGVGTGVPAEGRAGRAGRVALAGGLVERVAKVGATACKAGGSQARVS